MRLNPESSRPSRRELPPARSAPSHVKAVTQNSIADRCDPSTCVKKIKLEIAVNDNFMTPTVNASIKAAKSGKIGDGKICVMPLEQCMRIRTGEKGSDAIG